MTIPNLLTPSRQDTLSASTTLLNYVAAAFTQLAAHGESIRTQMKAVRKSEEDLDELKKRRKAVGAQADAADKKLAKMNSEVCAAITFVDVGCLADEGK